MPIATAAAATAVGRARESVSGAFRRGPVEVERADACGHEVDERPHPLGQLLPAQVAQVVPAVVGRDVGETGHQRADGHFGMVGMRERAEKIGGAITISSIPSGGSEVTLALPTRLAFARRRPRLPAWWLRFLRGDSTDG